jgi:NitT/TauT family transport system substrate-binding protein
MHIMQSRRDFLTTLSAAGAAGILGARESLAVEGPPETTTIRLGRLRSLCLAPEYAAEELLRAEGFTDVRYVALEAGADNATGIARGEVDFSLNFAAPLVIPIDAGEPIKVIAGVHPGCFELFANERVRSILDLKGKSVGVQGLGSTRTCSWRSWPHMSGLIPSRTSTGSPVPPSGQKSCSPRAKSMRSSAFRPSPRNCAPEISAT